MCRLCGRRTVARELCHACYEYQRQTGRQRSQQLIVSHARRVFIEGKKK